MRARRHALFITRRYKIIVSYARAARRDTPLPARHAGRSNFSSICDDAEWAILERLLTAAISAPLSMLHAIAGAAARRFYATRVTEELLSPLRCRRKEASLGADRRML